MIVRLLHLTVVAALIIAAVFVYKIKFESTVRAAEVARLASAIKREQDATASLKAEWAQLNTPIRIQGLADRHLSLRILDLAQIERFDRLPERLVPVGAPDPIAAVIDAYEGKRPDIEKTAPVAARRNEGGP